MIKFIRKCTINGTTILFVSKYIHPKVKLGTLMLINIIGFLKYCVCNAKKHTVVIKIAIHWFSVNMKSKV